MSESTAGEPQPGCGSVPPGLERLRLAREAAGVDIGVMASILKVPVHRLDALEQGRFDQLPDPTFARALATSACRYLKMDPEPVLAECPDLRLATLTPMVTDDKPVFRTDRAGLSLLRWLPSLPKLPSQRVAIALLFCAVVVYWWPRTPDTGPQTAGASASGAAGAGFLASMSSSQTSDVKPKSSPDDNLSDPPPAAVGREPASRPITAEGDAERSGDALSPRLASDEDVLRIIATGDTWLEVVDGKGTALLRRMIRAGEEHLFGATPPFKVVVGNAGAVRVVVRGRGFNTLPYVQNGVAMFEVQ